MRLDSDITGADERLTVEFYTSKRVKSEGIPYVRIIVPGDQTQIFDQPARDFHKERFPRQWLHYQMQNNDAPVIGVPLLEWHKDRPAEVSKGMVEELTVLKFQTVEQVATASDRQLERVMGGIGIRTLARSYIQSRNQSAQSRELEDAKAQLAKLQSQMAELLDAKRGPGRPRKDAEAA